jgi:HEAT repeat protein
MRTPLRRRKHGRRRDLHKLLAALTHVELVDDGESVVDLGAQTRAEALAALAELGPEEAAEAVEPVRERLEDPIPWVRQAAVRTLAVLDSDGSREALLQGLISWPAPPYGDARLEALRVLQAVDAEGLPERLVRAAAASNGSAVLDGITRRAVVNLVSEADSGARPAETVRLLIDMVRRADGNRTNLEILLAWLGEHSVDDLIDGLGDPELRESAATVLGALRESRAVPGLVGCLEDERVDVRLASARALGEIRDVRGVEGLIRAVSDPDYEVRREAQEALDALGTVGVVAGVSAVLQLVMKNSQQELPKPGTN